MKLNSEYIWIKDWRKKGVVSPVKNQARCGSCWAFATNAVIESHYNIKYNIQNQFIDLSEQNFIECSDSSYGNQACQGGLMKYAFDYLVKTGRGIHTEEDYPVSFINQYKLKRWWLVFN